MDLSLTRVKGVKVICIGTSTFPTSAKSRSSHPAVVIVLIVQLADCAGFGLSLKTATPPSPSVIMAVSFFDIGVLAVVVVLMVNIVVDDHLFLNVRLMLQLVPYFECFRQQK